MNIIIKPIPAVRFIDQQHNHGIDKWTFHNSVIAAFIGWQDCRNGRKQAVRFGNDDVMDESTLQAIANFMDENKVSYKWKKGDFFALNNRLVMHSRNSFTGLRRVYAMRLKVDIVVWIVPVIMETKNKQDLVFKEL